MLKNKSLPKINYGGVLKQFYYNFNKLINNFGDHLSLSFLSLFWENNFGSGSDYFPNGEDRFVNVLNGVIYMDCI